MQMNMHYYQGKHMKLCNIKGMLLYKNEIKLKWWDTMFFYKNVYAKKKELEGKKERENT